MEIQYPWLLLALPALPLVFLLWLLMMRWRKKAMARYGSHELIIQMIPDFSKRRITFKFILIFIAFALILIGMSNPRFGYRMENVKKEGHDIIICLDISNSMRARDNKPDRLERAKMGIEKLIDRFEDDQIGLVVFAGRAQTLYPLSPDYAGAKMFLESAQPDIIPAQGTAIGAAIDLAASSFTMKSKTKKIIILISDGENHEDDAVASAKAAAEKGILIYTIGMGSAVGAPIPMTGINGNPEYKKDENGNTVVSKLNEGMLHEIATAGKGTYTLASSEDAGLNKIYDEIGKLDKAEYEARDFTEYENLFPYFMAAGLLLMTAEFFIFGRKTRLTRNIKIFSKPASSFVKSTKNGSNA